LVASAFKQFKFVGNHYINKLHDKTIFVVIMNI
jgi:hypothetical protein